MKCFQRASLEELELFWKNCFMQYTLFFILKNVLEIKYLCLVNLKLIQGVA